MTFNLDYHNTNNERIGYFPYTSGVDSSGNRCVMVLLRDPVISGCNPFYWEPQVSNRFGYEFTNQLDAETQAKYARGSWLVKSVNIDEFKIGIVKFNVTKTAVDMGDAW